MARPKEGVSYPEEDPRYALNRPLQCGDVGIENQLEELNHLRGLRNESLSLKTAITLAEIPRIMNVGPDIPDGARFTSIIHRELF